jgi:hypothetical protein
MVSDHAGGTSISGYEIVTSQPSDAPLFETGVGEAVCPSGKQPLGGGAEITPDVDSGNSPDSKLTWRGWYARMYNSGTMLRDEWITVYAICANVSS